MSPLTGADLDGLVDAAYSRGRNDEEAEAVQRERNAAFNARVAGEHDGRRCVREELDRKAKGTLDHVDRYLDQAEDGLTPKQKERVQGRFDYARRALHGFLDVLRETDAA